MKKLLFVCTGNTCRSSMAEAIARKIIADRGLNILVSSAGVFALPGDKASFQAVEAVKEWGIDLGAHCARKLNGDMVKDADFIITMTDQHKRAVIQNFPDAKGKAFTLNEFAYGTPGDIKDPFGQDLDVYKVCAAELMKGIEKIIDRIME